MKESPLPEQWACLEGKVSYVRQESHTTWTCSCPKCGGTAHPGGEPSDRCTLFIDPKPTLFCRRCGLVGFPDQFGGPDSPRPDAATMERMRQERIEYEEARKRSAEQALEILRSSHLWQRYNENLDDTTRGIWRGRGIPDSLQDYWQLGYDAAHKFWKNGAEFTNATITIPIFDERWQALNIKHRLMNPPDHYGKYRYELRGASGGYLFRTEPSESLAGHVVVVEGEVKSMVVAVRGGSKMGAIVGIPGTNPGPEVLALLKEADRVTLVMDPGAKAAGIKIAKSIGIAKCRLLETVQKIDDAAIAQDMTERELWWLLKGATVLSAFVVAK